MNIKWPNNFVKTRRQVSPYFFDQGRSFRKVIFKGSTNIWDLKSQLPACQNFTKPPKFKFGGLNSHSCLLFCLVDLIWQQHEMRREEAMIFFFSFFFIFLPIFPKIWQAFHHRNAQLMHHYFDYQETHYFDCQLRKKPNLNYRPSLRQKLTEGLDDTSRAHRRFFNLHFRALNHSGLYQKRLWFVSRAPQWASSLSLAQVTRGQCSLLPSSTADCKSFKPTRDPRAHVTCRFCPLVFFRWKNVSLI